VYCYGTVVSFHIWSFTEGFFVIEPFFVFVIVATFTLAFFLVAWDKPIVTAVQAVVVADSTRLALSLLLHVSSIALLNKQA
jgi:hypothetical protein